MDKVVITGGARGIGRSLALGYAKAGYAVYTLDILEAEHGDPNIHHMLVDLCDEQQISAAFKKIAEQGAIHVLINNGAISSFHKAITDISVAEFDKVINTNLRGSFICAKNFVEANKPADYGRIINIASTRFHQNEANWEAYGASKGGIVALTNSLCVSLSNTHITVNAISPGWIANDHYEEISLADHQQHPSGRVGKPEDITRACLFLSAKESDFINGANLIVDGGMTKKMIYL
ncbi:MAG: SDR family oxidoreductase [Erysipelotrichaceae bacterium]|nr:SDR family oxidoreductase [Erysipelotrichaceae bacterium]MDY5252868.1 SDR family oxidoreductase [Erysipelotrichaceae bacterium]